MEGSVCCEGRPSGRKEPCRVEGRLGGVVAWTRAHCLLPAGHGRADEDCGDERARQREERLLGARLDRDQEKLLR